MANPTITLISENGKTLIVSPAQAKTFVLSSQARGIAGMLTFRGTYSGTTAYNIDDVVSYGGSSYAKIITTGAGILPTDTTKWQLMASGYDITISSTAPPNPNLNSLWIDTS